LTRHGLTPFGSNPATGERVTLDRATRLASALDDGYGLGLWRARQTLIGAEHSSEGREIARELIASKAGMRDRIARLVELSGGNEAKRRGTDRHRTVASVMSGHLSLADAPEPMAAEIGAVCAALDNLGDCQRVETEIVSWPLRAAGTADYVLTDPDGRTVVVDLKTGNTKAYHSWPAQLAVYGSGTYYDGSGPVSETTPRLVILWAPQNGKPLKVLEYDYLAAYRVAAACRTAMDARKNAPKAKNLIIQPSQNAE